MLRALVYCMQTLSHPHINYYSFSSAIKNKSNNDYYDIFTTHLHFIAKLHKVDNIIVRILNCFALAN